MPQTAIPNIDIEHYLDLLVRRKWWVIVSVVFSMLAGIVYIMITPKMYKANTLILVQPQKVPTSYVAPTVTLSLESRLRTITQQVYSRTNLQNIIDQFDLYAKDREETPMVELVEDLRKKIGINLRGGGSSQSFQISFQWNDPKTTADVTNTLASQFIEQNLKVREDMAMGTTAFLENEVVKLRQKLEAQEEKVEHFKKQHMGMLPKQLPSNINILGQLKQELEALEARVQAEKEQYIMLQRQIEMFQIIQMQSSDLIEIAPEEPGEIQSEDLSNLEAQLRQLRLRYTEKHPDIKALKRKIARIQERLAAEPNQDEVSMPETAEESRVQFDNPLAYQQDQLKFQLDEINRNIRSYQKKIRKVKKEIRFYNDRIERTPEVELELTKLTRDHSTLLSRYQNLLQKRTEAGMSEQLERRQKGEQFRVLDPAIVPEKPFKPNIPKVLLMALMAGMGFGCGLAYLREMMAGTFYSTEDLESFLGTKVLVSVPFVKGNV